MSLLTQQPSSLLKKRSFNILRRTRPTTLPDGFYTPPAPTVIPIEALVYPILNQDIIQILPEGIRKRKVVRILSNVELKEQINKSQFEADEFEYNGESYRVFRLAGWVNVSGFTGYDGYAVRAEAKELSGMGS